VRWRFRSGGGAGVMKKAMSDEMTLWVEDEEIVRSSRSTMRENKSKTLLSDAVGGSPARALAQRLGQHKGPSGGRVYINEACEFFAPLMTAGGSSIDISARSKTTRGSPLRMSTEALHRDGAGMGHVERAIQGAILWSRNRRSEMAQSGCERFPRARQTRRESTVDLRKRVRLAPTRIAAERRSEPFLKRASQVRVLPGALQQVRVRGTF
jgi:hypothetical protein